jgi:hypothetical protein
VDSADSECAWLGLVLMGADISDRVYVTCRGPDVTLDLGGGPSRVLELWPQSLISFRGPFAGFLSRPSQV